MDRKKGSVSNTCDTSAGSHQQRDTRQCAHSFTIFAFTLIFLSAEPWRCVTFLKLMLMMCMSAAGLATSFLLLHHLVSQKSIT